MFLFLSMRLTWGLSPKHKDLWEILNTQVIPFSPCPESLKISLVNFPWPRTTKPRQTKWRMEREALMSSWATAKVPIVGWTRNTGPNRAMPCLMTRIPAVKCVIRWFLSLREHYVTAYTNLWYGVYRIHICPHSETKNRLLLLRPQWTKDTRLNQG